jgi:hypothetical protein
MVLASPYGLALGSKVKKSSFNCDFRKNCKRGNAKGDNMAIYVKCDVVFLEK